MTPLDIKPRFTEIAFRNLLEPLIAGRTHEHFFSQKGATRR
jgi:hypothetical protein